MNSLAKGTWVIVGVAAVLWSGAQLFKEESRREQVTLRTQQHPANDKVLHDFQREVAALRNRLTQVEHAQPNLARLQGRLTQLEDGQQELRAELNTTPPQDTRLPAGEAIDGATVAPEAAEGERGQKLLTFFATQFLQEADDPTWSRQTEAFLTQAVTSAAFDDSHLLAAACRTTLCQVEVAHEGEGAQEGFIENFPFALSFDTEVFYHHIEDEGGTPYTVMYLARAGQRLPMSAQ